MDLGAAGVMIAGHAGLRTDEQIAAYFRTAVEAIGPGTPFVLQDYPLTFSVVLSVPVIARLMAEHPSCVMLKHEDWPGLEKISALRRLQAAGELLRHLDPDRQQRALPRLRAGARRRRREHRLRLPRHAGGVVALQRAGEREEAHDLFDAHLPLIRIEQQQGVGLAVRKYLLMRRGAIACDVQRKPGTALTEAGRAEIDYLLDRLGRRDPEARI